MNKITYQEGEIVGYYKNKIYHKVKIIKIHYDDLEPYYTILFQGHEIQTVKNKIIKLLN